MNVVFDHQEPISKGIKTFWFMPEKPVSYMPGQFIELYLPHPNADARGPRRWFSLSSVAADTPLISITSKFDDPGSSFKRALQQLEPGAVLAMAEPMGDFVLPKDPTIPLVFAASGMGITPVYSMVKHLHLAKDYRSIKLIYAVREPSDLVFMPLFKACPNLDITTIIKNPAAGYTGLIGSLNPNHITASAGLKGDSLIYISGPEPLVERLYNDLRSLGYPDYRLARDYFLGYE